MTPPSSAHAAGKPLITLPVHSSRLRKSETLIIEDSDSGSSCTNFDDVELTDNFVPPTSTHKKLEARPGPHPVHSRSIPSAPCLRDKAYEAFCGAAGLTGSLTKAGFKAIGIDYKGNKDKPKARCIWLDLTRKADQKESLAMVKSKDVAYVHFAPPCGTASRARDRRRFNKDGSPAALDPKPLRSPEHPDGLPNLQPVDEDRVSSANELYRFTAEAVTELSKAGVAWSIENPANSYMWSTEAFIWLRSLADAGKFSFKSVLFDSCMHGGERPKATTFWVSSELDFSSLALKCDNSHAHKPWGLTQEPGYIFATAAERNYPHLLCQRIAKIVAKRFEISPVAPTAQLDKASARLQPKKRFDALVREYTQVLTFKDLDAAELDQVRALLASATKKTCFWRDLEFPEGSKLLKVFPSSGDSDLSNIDIGVGWTTEHFTKQAASVTHPYDDPVTVSPEVARAIWQAATLSPNITVSKRKLAILRYTKIKNELQDRERELHSQLHPDVERVVASKNILLFKKMLEDAQYDDIEVHRLLVTGVALTGTLEPLGFWPADPEKLPKITSKMLWAGAKEAQKEVLLAAETSDIELEKALHFSRSF